MLNKDMTNIIELILARCAVVILKLINVPFKLLKLKKRVLIISRQENNKTLDISLLSKCLKDEGIEVIVLTKRIERRFSEYIVYFMHLIIQLFYLATSKVVVLDGYSILISILPKRKKQYVVQMWHAMGAIKKFGWQNVDYRNGHKSDMAQIMKMHRNYDYIIAPSKITAASFVEAFNSSMDKVVYYGLPRVDFLLADTTVEEERIYDTYPNIKSKKKILYVPTFRKNVEVKIDDMIKKIQSEEYCLIMKKHFLDNNDYSYAGNTNVIIDQKYSSMEWLKICDKVITDYSAIIFEAAILNKDIYLYQPDKAEYVANVGINIELEREAIGMYVYESAEELVNGLNLPYNNNAVDIFKQKYVEVDLHSATKQICLFIEQLL